MMTSCATTPPVSPAARAELAPTGKLRAGINFQNVLLTTLGPNGEQGGVAVELVRELAKRLDVPLEILPYKSAGSLADAVRTGVWDVAVLGDEPQRAKEIAFAGALTEIEATYLVPAASALRSVDEVDRPGVRIAVSANSAYDLYLRRTIKQAQLVPIAGTAATLKHYADEKLEALAGLKPQLLEFAPQMPGSRILPGNFNVVRHTAGTIPGRNAGSAYLR
ncbi:MAG TPA: transporter substrate-binding domain-containing protein, partial [Burkholderiales bacterium]|nr:transporter substrate-binding domain-containing protein [Burkholderiales bacterium]